MQSLNPTPIHRPNRFNITHTGLARSIAPSPSPHARKGFAIIYVTLLLIVLVAFVALGVDIGYLHLAKTELQVAADAAARAGASLVPDLAPTLNLTDARDRAVATAAANTAAQATVTLDPDQDVAFGFWKPDTGFTPLTGQDLKSANAVRVIARRIADRNTAIPLFFAPVLGRNSADVQAEAIAKASGGTYTTGLVGIDFIRMNGVTSTNSYDSTAGTYPAPYSSSTPGQNGDITSNGYIDLVGRVVVNGEAVAGPDSSQGDIVTQTSNTTITQPPPENLPQDLIFPPVNTDPYISGNNNAVIPSTYYNASTQNFTMKAKDTYTLQGGTTEYVRYYFNNFDIAAGATLTISGKVDICTTGEFKIHGNVDNVNHSPGNFRINIAGSGPATISGNSDLYADVYAPQCPMTFNGLGNPKDPLGLFGAVIAKSLTVNGNSDLHYDESLKKLVRIPPKIVLVK